MKLEGKRVGFVITGAFCAFTKAIQELKMLVMQNAEVLPIMSYNAYNLDTKFGNSKDFIEKVEKITRQEYNTYNTRC